MDETRFYYSTDGTDSLGPVPPTDLRKLYEEGTISTDSFLCREGETTWEPFDPASLPAPEPAPIKTIKVPTKALPETKAAFRPAYRTDTKPLAKPEVKAEIKPKTELKPRTEFKAKLEPRVEPAPVVDSSESADEGWENNTIRIIAWGLCGFVAFDTALFLTWQRPVGTPHTLLSTILFFVGEIFFVLVIPVLISRAVPLALRYRAQAGLTLLLALVFIGLRFALPSGKPAVASMSTPSTNAAPVASVVTPPPTNAPAAAVETSSSSTNAASLALPETNAAPVTTAPTNAAPEIAPVTPPATNAAPAVANVPDTTTNAAPVIPPVPPAPPTPPPAPAPDPAAIARDVQRVNDALTEKVKASVAAEAACPNFNPATITTKENVAQRQAAITAWQTMQANVLSYLQSYDDHVRDALAHQNLSPKDLDAAVADARSKAQVNQLVVLWQLKIKLSGDQLARLLFLDKSWDHWSGKTGKLVFDDKGVLDDYTNFLVTLQQDVKEIADIQKQITSTP